MIRVLFLFLIALVVAGYSQYFDQKWVEPAMPNHDQASIDIERGNLDYQRLHREWLQRHPEAAEAPKTAPE